ncbi:MAG TPA: hypothetical protein VIV63_03185 [Steroidobacteraceae bacterium]
MTSVGFRRMLAVMTMAGIACFATAAFAKPSGNWRISFNHQSDNDGAIVFRIAPVGGTPIDVEVKVPAKTTENNVADLVSAAIKATVGSEAYRVGVDDGEDVVVKKRGKTPKFELSMVSTSLTGLEIKVGHN